MQKGMSMKMNGVIASFRVVARRLGCIPVLETKERMAGGGQAARWAVYQDMGDERQEDRRVADHTTPARGQGADGRGECQVVAGKKKTGGRREMVDRRSEEQERSKIRGTLAKMASTGRLSVPRPGTTSSVEGGGGE